jgi:outer membrane receptor protein involved in Fe transport
MRFTSILRSLVLFGLIGSFNCSLFAQDATGKLVGTVVDPQGAVVPGAKITVTNVTTGVTREAVTTSDGSYLVNSVPIGTYTVTVEKTGFAKVVSPAQQLQINQNLKIDMHLAVGSGTETVDVQAQAAGVETVSSTLGQSVTSRPLVNLPLNGRNVLQLALLQPGVTEVNPDSMAAGSFSIAGGRSDSVTYLLDGGMNNNLLNNAIVYNPNPDAIQEFRLLTSNYSAEYGRNSGGIISVVTKSGTNQIHGSAFDFLRNDALNANTYFNKQQGLARNVLKRNQFGFTLGGPVVIPKVVDGRDKFFWFTSYQGQRLSEVKANPNNGSAVFTPAQLAGNFAGDPNVIAFLTNPANSYFQPNPALAAQGIIDPTKIDPVAKKYIAAGLIPTSATGLLAENSAATSNNDEITTKFDVNFTTSDRLSFTLGAGRAPSTVAYSSTSSSLYPVANTNNRYFGNFAYTKIFSPSVLNEARFTAQRIRTVSYKPGRSLPNNSDLGVATTPDAPSGPPRLEFLDSGLALGFSPQGPQSIINNTFGYSDTVTWQKGRHNWKFGFNFIPYQNNTLYDFYVNGDFFFYGSNTSVGSGNEFADFLFGAPDEYFQSPRAPSNIRSKSTYAFAQDEWHATPNLTLTLGIRYEYSTPKSDTQGRSYGLVPGAHSTVFVNSPIGIVYPGDPASPTGSNFPDKNDWAPRAGFAWAPFGGSKSSVRGGFGVFYDVLKAEDNLQFNGQPPFFSSSDLFFGSPTGGSSTNPFAAPYAASGATNPFPSHAPSSTFDFTSLGGPFGIFGQFFEDAHLRTPYTYQFNLSLQQELVSNIVFEASYVGSLSRKLTALQDANPFILGTTNRVMNLAPGNSTCTQASGFCSLGYLDTFRNVGSANYNSLETSLTKKPSSTGWLGTTYFTFAYTLAHNIDNSSGFRNRNSAVPSYNPNLFRGNSDMDVRHRVTLSGGWDLPFDRRFKNRLTSGWSVYPILSYRTGFPLDILAGRTRGAGDRPGPSGAGDGELVRVNISGTPRYLDPRNPTTFAVPNAATATVTGAFWFDPTIFNRTGIASSTSLAPVANPSLRTYGTLPRNFLRGPGRSNLDFSIAKSTQIYERLNMEFRSEFFNILNHAEFNNPSTSFAGGNLGLITSTADPRIIQFALKFTF